MGKAHYDGLLKEARKAYIQSAPGQAPAYRLDSGFSGFIASWPVVKWPVRKPPKQNAEKISKKDKFFCKKSGARFVYMMKANFVSFGGGFVFGLHWPVTTVHRPSQRPFRLWLS